MKGRIPALLGCILTAICSAASGATLHFSDSFETGDRSSTKDGFAWTLSTPNATVSRDHARTGNYAIKCLYKGNPTGGDSTCEQRFDLGGGHTELWIRWYLRIPDNYLHRPDSPSNNKLLVMWSKDYKDMGNRQSIYYWSAGSSGSSTMSFVPTYGNHIGIGPVIVNPSSDRGKWFEYTLHWKRASGSGRRDGVLQLWLRKGDEERRVVFDHNDVDNWGPDFGKDPSYNFIDRGYLMGWANSGYAEDTAFYIDDVTFSTSPIEETTRPEPPTTIQVN